MAREVWITGIGLTSSLGEGLEAHWQAMVEAERPQPVIDRSFAPPYAIHPMVDFDLNKQIPKRADQRQMDTWQRLGVYTAGLALEDAGIAGNLDILGHTHAVVAADGGARDEDVDDSILNGLDSAPDAAAYLNQRLSNDLRPTLFLAQLPNLLAGNISIVHKLTGSSRTFMGEEIAGVARRSRLAPHPRRPGRHLPGRRRQPGRPQGHGAQLRAGRHPVDRRTGLRLGPAGEGRRFDLRLGRRFHRAGSARPCRGAGCRALCPAGGYPHRPDPPPPRRRYRRRWPPVRRHAARGQPAGRRHLGRHRRRHADARRTGPARPIDRRRPIRIPCAP